MRNYSHILIFLTIFFILTVFVRGQELSDSEIRKLLSKATEKTSEYSEVFKNLRVEETKTFENYDEKGNLKSQKKILSDLIIFEPEDKKGNIGEFRNVREVDGKKIKDNDKRTVKVFAELVDEKSFAAELNKLNKESFRFDKDLTLYGFTAFQVIPLALNLISSFKFEEIGRETLEDKEFVIIKFQQIAENPGIIFKVDAPEFLKVSKRFYRGTIWLDLKNYRVLQFVSEFVIDSAKFTEPVVLLKQEYFYQLSNFGIYLPRKIIAENFYLQIGKREKILLKAGKITINSRLQTRLTMEYKNYSKFDVKVKSN